MLRLRLCGLLSSCSAALAEVRGPLSASDRPHLDTLPCTSSNGGVFQHRRTGRWLATLASSPSLTGRCECGAVHWHTEGSSHLNFSCHCPACRQSSGEPATNASGFRSSQITWTNKDGAKTGSGRQIPSDDVVERDGTDAQHRTSDDLPGLGGSRYFCKHCHSYLGENAEGALGLVMLAHSSAERCASPLPPEYRVNHHVFYENRVMEVSDAVPKWRALPNGQAVGAELQAAGSGDMSAEHLRAVRSWLFASDPSAPSTSYNGYQVVKDVHPVSPLRAPAPSDYSFTESDPPANHTTRISPEALRRRVVDKYEMPSSSSSCVTPKKLTRDVVIVGGGHNGLVCAAYLAKAGLDVLVLERRHVVGGAAVTEEMVPGFKFSRCSYLAGLFRPQIIRELQLEQRGFEYIVRDPSSFTPTAARDGPSLLMGSDEHATLASIARLSARDSATYPQYEALLEAARDVCDELLDGPPPNPFRPLRHGGSLAELRHRLVELQRLGRIAGNAVRHSGRLASIYELLTGPAAPILDRWFDDELLKTTLATDAVIGAHHAPSHCGSGYMLLHHVMGEAAGRKGVWAYVRGGMGGISNSVARAAIDFGAEIITSAPVERILYSDDDNDDRQRATGVHLSNGLQIHATRAVISNATPYHTFLELLPGLDSELQRNPLPRPFTEHIRHADYSCGSFKINCAIDRLPDFLCLPNAPNQAGPQHRGTIHFSQSMEELENAYRDASVGMPARVPVVEMTIPSTLDNTLAPPGQHVAQLFVQYAPFAVNPKFGSWADPLFKEAFVHRVFGLVDRFAPGFSDSIIGYDALSPLDLERIFGLQGGSISHGALSLHQLAYARPAPGFADYRTPLSHLYLCGAGTHPGGGVMGAAGRNCAFEVLADLDIPPLDFPK